MHVLFPDRGLKWGCRECNTDPHDLWPRKAAWSSAHLQKKRKEKKTLTPSLQIFKGKQKPLHIAYVFSCPMICIQCIHISDLSPYSSLLLDPDANSPNLKWEVGKKAEKEKLFYFQAQCLQATCLQSSVTSLHTYYDTSTLSGNPLSPLGRQRRLTGCWMGLPQVPLGSHIRPNWQTDRSVHTHIQKTHTTLSRAHSSNCTPAPTLPRHGTLCIKQWLCFTSIFFFQTQNYFSPL